MRASHTVSNHEVSWDETINLTEISTSAWEIVISSWCRIQNVYINLIRGYSLLGRSNAVFFTRTHHLISCLFPSCSLSLRNHERNLNWKEKNCLADFWSKISKQSKQAFSKAFSTISTDIQQGHEAITEFSSKGLDALQNLTDSYHPVSLQIVPAYKARRIVTLDINSVARHLSSTYILDWSRHCRSILLSKPMFWLLGGFAGKNFNINGR